MCLNNRDLNNRIYTILMFLGRELSRQNLRRPPLAGHSLRACTSEKRISISSPAPDYSTVGPYRFRQQDLIGKGFSSRVYKATHSQREGETYAIKVINLCKFKSSNLAMLQHEIEVHRILSHPNIIKFYDAYKTDNFYYIVTQYCPHGDLSTLLNQKKRLDESKAEDVICQIISGYNYMLKKGVIHRDLKPANIMRHGNTWKIGDFGFSIFCKAEFYFDKLNVGTPLYMPLEALKTNKYSFKSDVFALGIILYEMLNGKTPWDCKTQKQLVAKMSKDKIKFPLAIKEHLQTFIENACNMNEFERMSKEDLNKFLVKNSATNPEENGSHKIIESAKEDHRPPKATESLKQLKTSQSTPKISLNCSVKNLQSCKSYNKIPVRKQESSTEISLEHSDRPQQTLANANSRPSSSIKKVSNTEFLLRELQFCRLIYYMIKNLKYFPLSESKKKNFIELVLFKHLLRCIKHLEDPGVHFSEHLVGFAQYRYQKQYLNMQAQIRNYVQRYERQYLDTLKNTDILVIRAVNRKFPELSYTTSFTKKFYDQFYHYFCGILRECNHEVASKGESSPSSEIQAIESIYIYTQVIEQKSQPFSLKEEVGHKKSFLNGLGNKISMDYGRSKLTFSAYKELRESIRSL